MAWLAAVRLAPAADSSRRLSSSTRGSPFLTSSLDWNDSMMVERWLAVPLSMAVGTPASRRASCTLTSKSMNCTKISTRSSPGVDFIRRTTADSLAPCWRPPMITSSLASSTPMAPRQAAGGARRRLAAVVHALLLVGRLDHGAEPAQVAAAREQCEIARRRLCERGGPPREQHPYGGA